jgi:hypothetical protein
MTFSSCFTISNLLPNPLDSYFLLSCLVVYFAYFGLLSLHVDMKYLPVYV